MGVTYSQFFPPKPTLTEANLPSQNGKVFIVTGGTAGVGFELCRMLYQAGGKVYIAGRSENSARDAIQTIKALPSVAAPSASSPGELHFLHVDLSDLTTIKSAAETFIATETRLDVLINNAGVGHPPKGSLTTQGHELQMGTNCLGHYLLTQLLLPILLQTSRASEPASVRVVWASSIAVEFAPKNSGLTNPTTDLTSPSMLQNDQQTNYALSKTGNWYLAQTLSDQVSKAGILSITQNPGNLKTQLTRHMSALVPIIAAPLLYHARFGAYTGLWCALSKDLGMGDGGGYFLPWGRKHPAPRADLVAGLRGKGEGGTGAAEEFTGWCEDQVKQYR